MTNAELELYIREHAELHKVLGEKLDKILERLGALWVYMGDGKNGSGGATISLREGRLRFAGSLPLKVSLLGGASSGGGIVWLVGRALNAW